MTSAMSSGHENGDDLARDPGFCGLSVRGDTKSDTCTTSHCIVDGEIIFNKIIQE